MIRIAGRTLVFLSLFSVARLPAQQPAPAYEPTPAEQARLDVGPLVRTSNHAGSDLFSRLRATPGNMACSPYALTESLSLVSTGARSQTRAELDKTLAGLSEARLQAATLTLIKDMDVENPARPGGLRRNGTGLWPAANTRFAPGFLDLARRYYPEGLNSVAPNGSIRAAAPADLGQDMPVVEASAGAAVPAALLVSNTGFKGVWAYPFPMGATKEENFMVDKNTKVKAQIMHQTFLFGYAETPEMQILELPYADRDLRFLVILPRKQDGLAELEQSLTLERLSRLSSGMPRREVDVLLPRFQLVLHLRLRSELEKLGIRQAFTPEAQFAGLTAEKQPRLEQVLQDVSFEVDEGRSPKGQLPTPVAEKSGESNTVGFRADHPFLFVVRDMNRGGIVFIGRITDPNAPVPPPAK